MKMYWGSGVIAPCILLPGRKSVFLHSSTNKTGKTDYLRYTRNACQNQLQRKEKKRKVQ
jgi:hypothetical protein